uniref:Protein prenyltransferase alpha subunit repeat-containing protein 1 n=1 Tax=Rhizochromulina marina TaxID=1034831 RepID=A0A7S2SV50_9STRA|mmetsp:Transcript_9007/g.25723  ORF Transcript_9007/g.25723 Transcript_9007/m.25723 type:complete len:443 (+) Transcript_9007:188-1516(+)
MAAPESAETDLLSELRAVFTADPLIDEYGILPQDALPGDGSHFFVQEHKLAISRACLQTLFYQGVSKLEDPQWADAATRAVLLSSGDHYVAWHRRKLLVMQRAVDLEQELRLTAVVFSLRPKAGNAWSHRRFVAAEVAATATPGDLSTLWREELQVCAVLAHRSARNYYAWTHRLWVARRLGERDLAREVAWAQRAVAASSSDRSASHHLEQLLLLTSGRDGSSAPAPSVSNLEVATPAAIVEAERLVKENPGREALWQHLRSLFAATWSTVGGADVSLAPSDVESLEFVVSPHPEDSQRLDNEHRGGSPWVEAAFQIRFAHRCSTTPCAWNEGEQHRFARSHAMFVLFHVLRALRSTNPRHALVSVIQGRAVFLLAELQAGSSPQSAAMSTEDHPRPTGTAGSALSSDSHFNSGSHPVFWSALALDVAEFSPATTTRNPGR